MCTLSFGIVMLCFVHRIWWTTVELCIYWGDCVGMRGDGCDYE